MNIEYFNEQQQEAIKTTEGPLLVLAGAGSGKTAVLTTRIAYLIEEMGIDPSSILAITFTNKAAKEMRSRVINMLGRKAFDAQISTFHSFGIKIIQQYYEKIGYAKNFTILDSDDTLSVVKTILKEMNLDPKDYNPKEIRNKISSAKNENINYYDYEQYINTKYDEIVYSVFEKYQYKLRSNNSLDFDDLLLLPLNLLIKDKEVLTAVQNQYRYILIDEYQDTNTVQYNLAKLISASHNNICAVGDNDQSIYSFRGSNYTNILNFERDFKKAKVIMLEQNYRSTKNILDVANCIIKHNKLRKDKNLWTNNEPAENPMLHTAENEKDEAYYVKCQIEELINANIKYKDIAVLYRTNAQSRNMEEALLSANLPYRVVGSMYFYKRKEIKDLISYLRLINNPHDDISFLRAVGAPKRGIGPKALERLSNQAITNGTSLFESIEVGKELEFKKIIDNMRNQDLTLTELVEYVLLHSGLRAELQKDKSLENEIRIENLEEFKTITRNFELEKGIASLEDFLTEIALVADIEEHKKNDNLITLMTVHSAKGLEFDNVFIIGLDEGIFPHKNCMMSSKDIEEERRLCYVAVTRSRKKLWLINTRYRRIYGMENQSLPSRFVKEIDTSLIDTDNIDTVLSNKRQNTIDESIEYSEGEKISHEIFGNGVIVMIDKSTLTVAFPHPVGVKKVMKGHKSIKKTSF